MYVCKHCGQTFDAYTTICNRCGNAVVEAPQSGTPQYQAQSGYGYSSAPVYAAAPTYPVSKAPKASGGAIAMGVIGLLIGIESLFGSFVSMILSIISIAGAEEVMSDYNYWGYYSESDIELINGFAIFAFIQLFMAILGLVFCCVARGKGVSGGVTVTGKVFTIIAIVFGSIASICSIVALSMLP